MLHIQLDEHTTEHDLSYRDDHDLKVIEKSIAKSHFEAALWQSYNFMANDIFNSITVYLKLKDKELIPLTINRQSIYEDRAVIFPETCEAAISLLDSCDLAHTYVEDTLVSIINYVRQTQPTVNKALIFGKEHPQIVLHISKNDMGFHEVSTLIHLSKTPIVERETITNVLLKHD